MYANKKTMEKEYLERKKKVEKIFENLKKGKLAVIVSRHFK